MGKTLKINLILITAIQVLFTIGCSDDSSLGYQNSTAPVPSASEVNIITQNFAIEVDKGCPCLLPENEKNTKYSLSNQEIEALEENVKMMEENVMNDPEKKQKIVKSYQALHQAGLYETGKTAEQYVLNSLNDAPTIVAKLSTEKLNAMRMSITASIYNKNTLLKELNDQMDISFKQFCESELKALIQIRKIIIDELTKR